MLQRLQSIYLFLAFLACIAMFFFPLAEIKSELHLINWSLTGMEDLTKSNDRLLNFWALSPLLILDLAVALLSLFILYSYKDRIKQLKWLRKLVLVNILFIGLVFFYGSVLFEHNLGLTVQYKTGTYFPLISLIFLILANRGIRKDEAMVRAMDRLR